MEAQERFKRKSQWIASVSATSIRRESQREKQQRMAQLLYPSAYGRFFAYYFGAEAPSPLADARCAPFHIHAYKELVKHPFITQMRLWFRGAAKSMQTNIGNAFALKCRGSLRFMLLVASSEWRAKLLLADLQAQLESNQRIISDFGTQLQYGHWRDGAFETQDGCYFMALGINQPFRGLRRHAQRIDFAVVDDIEDRRHVRNRSLIHARVDKLAGELGAAFHKNRQRLVICNNYISRSGVIAGLMERFEGKAHFFASKVNLTNEHGKSTWPAYYSAQDIQAIHHRYDPYTLKREYYNTPIEQGKLFDEDNLRFAPLPETAAELMVGFWDFSYTSSGDFKAFALVALFNDIWYVCDIFCRQCDMMESMQWYFKRASQWQKTGASPYIYYDASVIQEHIFGPIMKREAARQQYFGSLPLPFKGMRQEKHGRIEMSLQSLIHHDQLCFSEALRGQADTRSACAQLMAFEPGITSYDDFPDALAAALHIGGLRRTQQECFLNEDQYLFGQRHMDNGF